MFGRTPSYSCSMSRIGHNSSPGSSRLFQRARAIVGESPLQLGCSAFDWLSVVHRSVACSAGSRRCDSLGSLPRVRGCMACSCRSANGSVRAVGNGSGSQFFSSSANGAGPSTIHRGRFRYDYGRRAGPAPPVSAAGGGAPRDQFPLPGDALLQFAFDGHADNPYLPHNFVHNTVAYTGTHDNATTRQWYEELPDYQRQNSGATSSVRREPVRMLLRS